MSSTFIRIDPSRIDRDFFGKNSPSQLAWLQFVPGITTSVIINEARGNASSINSIKAKPHISIDASGYNFKEQWYKPLLRGMADVPVKGDPVLLCTFAGQNYYFGPLNVDNDINFNKDPIQKENMGVYGPKAQTWTESMGISSDFERKSYNRLQKKWKEEIDGIDYGEDEDYIPELHGDMIFEGRHGNSIRIGSRSVNPYILISNGRSSKSSEESFADGSLIAMLNKGTMNQHLGGYIDANEMVQVPQFQLSSTVGNNPNNTINDLIADFNGANNAANVLHDYGSEVNQSQLIQNSGRIIINANVESIFMSSFKDVYIGAKENISITSNYQLVVDAETIDLGTNVTDRMVKGDELVTILEELVEAIKSIQVYPFSPTPIPLTAEPKNMSSSVTKLDAVKSKLETMLSDKCNLE